MYAKHRHAWIYRSIRACHAEALAKAGPLACLVGKTFPRFGCIALRAYLFSATGAGSFKPGATPQGNVAREDERCSDLSFEVHRRANAEREDWKASPSTRWQDWPPPLWLLGPTVAGNREPGHR